MVFVVGLRSADVFFGEILELSLLIIFSICYEKQYIW